MTVVFINIEAHRIYIYLSCCPTTLSLRSHLSSNFLVLNSSTLLLILVFVHTLDVLLSDSRGLLLGPAIQALSLEQVEVEGEHPSDNKANQRDEESLLSTNMVCDSAENRGEQSTSRYCSNDETGTTLGVTTKTSDRQSKDQREDTRLEEEDQRDGSDTSVALEAHGQAREENYTGEETDQDQTRLGNLEQTTCYETTNGEAALSYSKKVCTGSMSGARADRRHVVDEVAFSYC